MTETLLLDSSVFITAWNQKSAYQDAALEIVLDTDRPAAALDLTLYEVANVIGSRWGDPAGAAKVCRSIELRCREKLLRVDRDLVEVTVDVAAEYGLTGYDAAYVAIARRYGWQLVSLDVKDLVSKGLAVTPDAAV